MHPCLSLCLYALPSPIASVCIKPTSYNLLMICTELSIAAAPPPSICDPALPHGSLDQRKDRGPDRHMQQQHHHTYAMYLLFCLVSRNSRLTAAGQDPGDPATQPRRLRNQPNKQLSLTPSSPMDEPQSGRGDEASNRSLHATCKHWTEMDKKWEGRSDLCFSARYLLLTTSFSLHSPILGLCSLSCCDCFSIQYRNWKSEPDALSGLLDAPKRCPLYLYIVSHPIGCRAMSLNVTA